MSSPDGGTRRPLSENGQYAPDEYALPPAANRPLRPRRSHAAPVKIFIAFGSAALLVAIGISRLGPIEKLRPPSKMRPRRHRNGWIAFPNSPSSRPSVLSRWFWIALNPILLPELFPCRRCLQLKVPQSRSELDNAWQTDQSTNESSTSPSPPIVCNWRRLRADRQSRAVLREMAAEWLKLAEVAG